MIRYITRNSKAKCNDPGVIELDESQEFPVDGRKKMGDIVLVGMLVPGEYGGLGMCLENDDRKKKYLPKIATAECIGVWGLTEENTGSDDWRMLCVAKQDGDHWVINGAKIWITHGSFTQKMPPGTPGFTIGLKEHKLGMCKELWDLLQVLTKLHLSIWKKEKDVVKGFCAIKRFSFSWQTWLRKLKQHNYFIRKQYSRIISITYRKQWLKRYRYTADMVM